MATKELKWSNNDTPIPKKGEIISNRFGEKYKVIKKVKGKKDTLITLEAIERK